MPDKNCTWEEDLDGNLDSYWNTSCYNIFTLDEGTPEENQMKFCCYCGRPLKQRRYKKTLKTEGV